MERYKYPHTIESGSGEQITFIKHVKSDTDDYLEIENLLGPGSGPPMHVHFRQDEGLTVVNGKIGVQHLGGEEEFFGEGDTLTFKAGEPHRFWNAGSEPLICKACVRPALNIEYFLTEIYRSTKENGGKGPSQFDGAFLLGKYSSEFDMLEIPPFVKKVIFPLTVFIGKLTGKHKKFKDAPEALK